MEYPLVSVICACYNQSAFIRESLESVKNQTYPHLELVIWDDASSDHSAAVIEAWMRENPDLQITFTKNTENKGICKSLNEAQNLTKGKYIQLLALDDLLLPDKLMRQVELLEKSPDHQALLFSDALMINGRSEMLPNKFIAHHGYHSTLENGNYFERLLSGNFIPAMSILFKKSALTAAGPWDENLVYEDYDMLLRLARTSEFIYDEIPSVCYRIHGNNTHRKLSEEMKRSNFMIHLKQVDYSAEWAAQVKKKLVRLYKKKLLAGEQHLYFEQIPPKNFLDRWIHANKYRLFYIILVKLPFAKKWLQK